MSDFDDMLSALKELRREPSDPQKYLAHLLEIQNKSKIVNFKKYQSDKISSIFDDFWLFLMHSSSNSSNPSVRIAAIRAAAFFTLNLLPFYPEEIKNTFSTIATISTIDMEASSLIASVFGIISYRISTPYREQFLHSCPIFHHITESKSTQEHFISSLSHYSHLGLEFHRVIIKSFMLKITSDPNDKLYWHGVIEIVSNNPKELFLEVFNGIIENNAYQEHIQFMSNLLTIPDAPINSVNLYDIARFSLQLLYEYTNNKRDLTCNETSAVFKILSLKTNSFYVDCSTAGDGYLKISLSDAIQSDQTEKKIKIDTLDDSPEFYFLNLPPELAFPTGEEGSSLLACKMTLLFTHLDSQDEELVHKILNIIKDYVSKPYDTTVSACFQGISNSIPKLKNRDVLDEVVRILNETIYSPSKSWFHDMDRLKVIEAIPLDSASRSLGFKAIIPTFKQVLVWAKEKNEKLAKYAQQVLIHSFILQSDAEFLLSHVIKECDVFDSFDLVRTLEILNLYLEKYKKYFMPHFLIDFCKILLQLFTVYPDNPDVYIQILIFVTHFHIKKVRTRTLHICLCVILSTYNMITGMGASIRELNDLLMEEQTKMIESFSSKQSMDIIKENMNDYKSYIPHLYYTLKFLISVQKIDFKYVQPIVQYTINFFPYESSQIMYKYWKYFPQMSRTSLIGNNIECIKYACGFSCAGLWFELYMKASESISDSSSISNSVTSAPFAYSTYSNKDATFSSLTSKIDFSNALNYLKDFLNLSLNYMNCIDDKALLYYIHFYKFVYPSKQFDFNLIPESKRARVITLINRIPSKGRKKRSKNYSSGIFNTAKPSLTPSSSAPMYASTLPLVSIKTRTVSEFLFDTDQDQSEGESSLLNDDNDADNDNDHDNNSSIVADSNLIPSASDQSDRHSDHVSDNSDSESDFESESGSISLPTTIQKSGSDSLSGSESPINSESPIGSESGSLYTPQNLSPTDLSPFVSGSFSGNTVSRSSFISSGESPATSANISASSSYNFLIPLEENDVDHEDLPVSIYVPIDIPFEPPKVTTMDQLSEKLNVDDPLVEVQLKHGTYDFDEDELMELYEYYSKEEKKNPVILNLINEFANKNDINLGIPKEENAQQPSPRKGQVTNESAQRSILALRETQKIKKDSLLQLCRELNSSFHSQPFQRRRPRKSSDLEKKDEKEEDKDDSIQFEIIKKLLRSLTDSKKEYKLKLLLFTIGNVICTYTRIPFETAKLVITNFNDNYDKLPFIELSSCIEVFCQRVCKKGRPARFLTRMLTGTTIYDIGNENIVNSLAFCRNLPAKDSSFFIQKFLNDKSKPSTFRNSIKLMTILARDQNMIVPDLFNANTQAILNVYKLFKRNEPIHRQMGIFFNSIFREKYFEYLGKGATFPISSFQFPSNSLFSSYSICIPRFVKFIVAYQKHDYEFKDTRLIPFCKEYFELLNVEINLAEDKKAFALRKIEIFIEAVAKGKACVQRLDQYVMNWFVFLNQFFKFDSILNRLMPLAKIRFNGLFLGVIKFIKFYKKDLTPEELQHVTEWKIKCHAKAFKFALTDDKDLIRAAIQLSEFPDDCEESSDLIKKCQRHYNRVCGTEDDTNETEDDTNETEDDD
ncbi:hypothetical protein M9Y10_005333 [Tritrichomonas musculus]|uniref:Uncharacterized protein n=1 Tax=Tritrichomonas musculus TaxID=1915356 RepID=A0ABR2JLR6_9EUKA